MPDLDLVIFFSKLITWHWDRYLTHAAHLRTFRTLQEICWTGSVQLMDEKNAAISTSEILNGNSIWQQDPPKIHILKNWIKDTEGHWTTSQVQCVSSLCQHCTCVGDALNSGDKGWSSAAACANKAPYSDFRFVLGCVRTRGTAILGLKVCLWSKQNAWLGGWPWSKTCNTIRTVQTKNDWSHSCSTNFASSDSQEQDLEPSKHQRHLCTLLRAHRRVGPCCSTSRGQKGLVQLLVRNLNPSWKMNMSVKVCAPFGGQKECRSQAKAFLTNMFDVLEYKAG